MKYIAHLLWSIHNQKIDEPFKKVPKEKSIDAIGNLSNTTLLIEKTLHSKEFKDNPSVETLESLVTDTLKKFPFIAEWIQTVKKKYLPFTLWINYQLLKVQ